MKTKIAKILRQLADRLAPAPVVYPTKAEVQYEGETYSPLRLRSRHYLPTAAQVMEQDAARRQVREVLEHQAGRFATITRETSDDPDDAFIDGNLLILVRC